MAIASGILSGNHPLSRPVVVSEEALVTPVTVPELTSASVAKAAAAGPAYIVLGGISLSHFLNDTMQSLIPSVYPILKDSYALDFAQIGLITLAFQFTASLLQPVIGYFTDRKAQPFSLAIGMGFTFFGLLLLSAAHQYPVILIAAALVGLGSAVFHPESARIARLASGGRYGFAQSVFQVGRRSRRRSSPHSLNRIRTRRTRGGSRSRLPCWWHCCSPNSSMSPACRAI